MKALSSISRRYETDYAGAYRGFCKTRESAIVAAMRHIVQDGYTACTITDREKGEVVARLKLSNDHCAVVVHAERQFKKIGK